MTFGQFLSVMRARWWVVLGVLAATVGATVAVSWSIHFEAAVEKSEPSEGPLPLPWEIEVVRQ